MSLMTTRELIERHRNADQRVQLVEESAEAGMPYSAYLDLQYDPEKDGELAADDERLSAMEVVQEDLDMTTVCNPAAGIWPTRCADVIGDPAKEFTLKEMCLNTYRSISYRPQLQHAARQEERRSRWERAGTFQDVHDTPPGSTLTPYYDAMAHWDEDIEVDIPLEELTTRMSETDKKDYRATILEYDKDAFREEVRTPAADPPMATFETSERPIQLRKRMLAIPFTYEHLREVEFIDKALEHIEEIAVQRINAKVDEGIEAMLHGAPNDKDKDLGGTLIKLQDLDSEAESTMTGKAWLTLQKKFSRTYMLTSAIGTPGDITDLQLATVSSANVMLAGMNERPNAVTSGFGGAFSVINNLSQGTRIGWHDYLSERIQEGTGDSAKKHNALVVFDKRKAVEYVSAMNTDIIETTRDMLKQVEYVVCSETWGWISYQPKKAIYIVVMGNPASNAKLKVIE